MSAHAKVPPLLRSLLLLLTLVFAFCGPGTTQAAQEDKSTADLVEAALGAQTADEVVERYQQAQIDAIANAYDADQRDLASQLASLGYADLNGFSAENISAEALLGHAARRAEAGHQDDGRRLIAWLANRVQANSALATTDPALAPLKVYTPQELSAPFTFSTNMPRVATIKLPEAVELAVIALAAHGWPHASMSAVLLRNLHKLGFGSGTLDMIAKDAPSLAEYLRRAIAEGTPPPLPAEAILAIIAEVQSASALALTDPALNAIKAELESRLPATYEAMRMREVLTPTARAELAALRSAARQEGLPLASFKGWPGNDPDGGVPDPRAPRPDGPPPFSGTLAVDGSGFDPSSGKHATVARAAYQRWDQGTFGTGWRNRTDGSGPPDPVPDVPLSPSPNSGGGANPLNKGGAGPNARPAPSFHGGGLPRSFVRASRSIRGPGGISLGAAATSQITDHPVSGRWLPKPGAPQFGYFLITMRNASGGTYSALSRVFFAESADAAHRAALGWRTDQSPVFKEGDIFPMVSLTPEGSEEEVKAVVVNPALAGLKLAWSAVRADFWLRSFDGALKDATVLDPGVASAAARADMALFSAFTWQIRERAHDLRLVRSENGLMRVLSCIPGLACTVDAYPPGFEIVLFTDIPYLADCQGAPGCTPRAFLAKIEAIQLPALEKLLSRVAPEQREIARVFLMMELQESLKPLKQRPSETSAAWTKRLTDPEPREPGKHADADAATRYLGWLTQHHPDFIRLNDFHHAMALERWLAREGATATAPGALFAPRSYPIPNRIRGGDDGTPLEAFVAEEKQ
ncbi:hypothetical protein HFO21_07920 [Rhizobium laguerreae]|uniref:hypothetical protein n=1 Tax=Rhizobium laguerreae TaxID=1076926 RepID=UPI001C8FFA61|nr:hypothetical protein [Rhizobium laguerreae]MBY3214301.1 hypothetical protein [Rhizobium laguerreae]